MRAAVPIALGLALGYMLTRPAGAALAPWGDTPQWGAEPDQLPTLLETAAMMLDPSAYETGTLPGDLAEANVRAFLDMLAVSEGTAGRGDNGYNVLFGGGLFTSYADHPRQLITRMFRNGNTVTSSAAGRYQFLRKTWDGLNAKMTLPDFGSASQDAAAIELIRERGALADVRAGRFAGAVTKCRRTWASLPGAGYDQPEHTLDYLTAAFQLAGGTVST